MRKDEIHTYTRMYAQRCKEAMIPNGSDGVGSACVMKCVSKIRIFNLKHIVQNLEFYAQVLSLC